MASPITSELNSSSLPDAHSSIQYGNISRALAILSWMIALLLLLLAPADLEQSSAAGTFIILLGFGIMIAGALAAMVCGQLGRRKEQQQREAALAGLWLGSIALLVFPLVIPVIFFLSLKF